MDGTAPEHSCSFKADADSERARVAGLEGQVADLKGQVADLKGQIAVLLRQLYDKKSEKRAAPYKAPQPKADPVATQQKRPRGDCRRHGRGLVGAQ